MEKIRINRANLDNAIGTTKAAYKVVKGHFDNKSDVTKQAMTYALLSLTADRLAFGENMWIGKIVDALNCEEVPEEVRTYETIYKVLEVLGIEIYDEEEKNE